jgi:hypothetical protein
LSHRRYLQLSGLPLACPALRILPVRSSRGASDIANRNVTAAFGYAQAGRRI